MWTAPDSGLHQTQTSEQYPKGETRRQDLNCTETNPLGSFFNSIAIFLFIAFLFFIYFFFYFWCSNFSCISPILLLSQSTPLFLSSLHVLVLLLLPCSFSLFSSFNSLRVVVVLFPFLLSQSLFFPLVVSYSFSFPPFSTIPFSFHFYYSLLTCC